MQRSEAARPVGAVWVDAARPRTLGAGIVPVLVGTAAADSFIAWRFLCAAVVGVALQVGVNYANDYFDGIRGIDSRARVGPRRAVASGSVPPRSMRRAMWAAFAVAAVAGGALALAVEPLILVLGVVCFVAALTYSGGPKPYGSAALGEVFVFVFFGLVATVGSYFVQAERVSGVAIVAAIPVGMLAVAILVVNNLRDIDTDAPAGKRTLAVRLGDRRTRQLFATLVVAALASTSAVAVVVRSAWPLIALVSIPAAYPAVRAVSSARSPAELLPALGATARLHLAYGVLLALGLWTA